MIQTEERPLIARRPRLWSPALAPLLRRQRKAWLKAFKRCRATFTEESVHDVRVQSRRLMSALSLVRAALGTSTVDPVAARVKATIKRFARLRDVHVQGGLVRELARKHEEAEGLLRFLERREQSLTKRLKRELEQVEPRKLNQAVRQLEDRMEATEQDAGASFEQAIRIMGAMGTAFQQVQALQEQIDVQDTSTIHRVRVAFKSFRYMVEALAASRPSARPFRRKAMQAYQTRMGEIQDLDVLLARLAKFGIQQPEEKARMKRLEGVVLRKRGELIQEYLARAGELQNFWPLTGFPGVVAEWGRSREREAAVPRAPLRQ